MEGRLAGGAGTAPCRNAVYYGSRADDRAQRHQGGGTTNMTLLPVSMSWQTIHRAGRCGEYTRVVLPLQKSSTVMRWTKADASPRLHLVSITRFIECTWRLKCSKGKQRVLWKPL